MRTVLGALLRQAETRTLIILIAVAGGVWAFVELADEVVRGETQSFDERILLALRNPAIGFSRVYLGVHWPTDVLGGWTLGAAWALCCWWVVGRLAGTPAPEALGPRS